MRVSVMNCARMPEAPEITDDAALGGRLHLFQPKRGHRFGHDAILLAAAVPAQAGDHIVDLGAGVGTAGLAVLARVPGTQGTLVEIDAALAALARENIERNGFAERASVVTLDVEASAGAFATAGLPTQSADHVLMNPPFNNATLQASPDPARRRAHAAGERLLTTWLSAAARLVRPGGSVTVIWRAQDLPALLAEMTERFGGIATLPVHGTAGQPAIRVIVQGLSASVAPSFVLPGLALNNSDGTPAVEAEAVLRWGQALSLAESSSLLRRGATDMCAKAAIVPISNKRK